MKAHSRKCKAEGGGMDSPKSGEREWEEDEKDRPQRYDNAPKIEDAAEERKRGGRAKKKHVHVHGENAKHHAGRKPRKSGGRATGSNMSPLSSAHKGTPPRGHKDVEED